MDLLNYIKDNARALSKTIVLPEGDSERTLKAADIILSQNIARIILLGDKKSINSKAEEWDLQHLNGAEIIDPKQHSKREEMIKLLMELRAHKGLKREDAETLVNDPLYLAPLLIKAGYADGEVAGAENATGNVLRPAFQIVKTAPNRSVVSGAFIMIHQDSKFGEEGVLIFADCAVNPDPNEKELAEIALSSAQTAKKIAKIEPKVAMLSFSTKGSAKHPRAQKVIDAMKIAKETNPDIIIDGEMQADAAIIEAVGNKKAPDSKVAGSANVLVFPDLSSGNIGYKLVQRMGNCEAIGPVLQGMAAPINDLSRGCSVMDIVNLVAITANQASENK